MLRPRAPLFFSSSSVIRNMAGNVSFPITHRPRASLGGHWQPPLGDGILMVSPQLDYGPDSRLSANPGYPRREVDGLRWSGTSVAVPPTRGMPETTDEPYFQRLIKNSTGTESLRGSLLSAGIGGRGCARLSVSKAARSSKADPDERMILLDRTIPARFMWKVT